MANFTETDKFKIGTWYSMDSAPKGCDASNPCGEMWILGKSSCGEQRVIRWCMEYPAQRGCWMYAYTPTNYINEIQSFNPVNWMPLPE